MKGLAMMVAAAALALLPACNLLAVGSSDAAETGSRNSMAANAEGSETPSGDNESASRERPADERPADAPTRNRSGGDEQSGSPASAEQDWILGRWGDAGCATILEFQSGGTFLINGSPGQWSLDGDTLTMSGNGGEQVYTVARESGGFNIEDAEGNVQEMGRC